ncbi:MAG: UDP-N-acetylmuramate dehydrogenase [Aeromicrobium sp.]|nr:MAG: UDP-N-acetylmuramate dehydrogenase [Aeromicrobium sp.]
MRLSEVTTLRLGGPAQSCVVAHSESDLIEAVSSSDAGNEPVLIVAGGSNLVVSDDGFAGRVVLVRTSGIEIDQDACSGAMVTVAAGETFDELVRLAVANGWVGLEALSGIPGSVGATPIQNVGAYGQEVADTIVRVRVWDRRKRAVRTFMHADCDFSYRMSAFKRDPERFVILTVTFQFPLGDMSAPIAYAELARSLDVAQGDRAPSVAVREQVLDLRRGKGMVLDPADHDTWSAGSFFMNPILTPEQAELLPEAAPRHPQSDGRVKTSAAWLIDHAGFGKGFAGNGVSLSTKHPLALTNRGAGSAANLMALASEVRTGVQAAFGITLEIEPVLVGIAW